MRRGGWYPDPSGSTRERYHDGRSWTSEFRQAEVRPPIPVVEGPNHALHAVLTLLTFWFFGGWAWVWLIVAATNRKTVRYV